MNNGKRKRIAIIGTGISGLGAASLLYKHHDITVYEKNPYIGGHSRTVIAKTPDGDIPVDTGFIVFNNRNYPLLTKLFTHLGVSTAKSDMSFGVSIDNGWLEYGTRQLRHMFAQKRNIARPSYLRMVRDILYFNAQARRYIDSDPSITLEVCLRELGMGDWFRRYFLLAMGGAIWSTPPEQMLQFPACSFIRFFDNHGLLTVSDQPQWYTVHGGSREYVKRLVAPFHDDIRLNCGAQHVRRFEQGVQVIDTFRETIQYDEVIFACHADQALRMLATPTSAEQAVLGAFSYQPNRAVLHSDISFMPRRRGAWSSWIYLSEGRKDMHPAMSLSYWMNNLQPLGTEYPLIVTLNPAREPNAALVHDEYQFEHPVFNEAAIRSQASIVEIQGRDKLWYCGAYQRYGFHEDGLASAVAIVKQMGIEVPWN